MLLVALALAAVYVLWGSTYIAILFAIDSIPPFTMAGVRFAVAGTLLYGFLRLRGHPAPPRRHWLSALVVGSLLLVGGNGSVTWAEQRVPSGIAALIIAVACAMFRLLRGPSLMDRVVALDVGDRDDVGRGRRSRPEALQGRGRAVWPARAVTLSGTLSRVKCHEPAFFLQSTGFSPAGSVGRGDRAPPPPRPLGSIETILRRSPRRLRCLVPTRTTTPRPTPTGRSTAAMRTKWPTCSPTTASSPGSTAAASSGPGRWSAAWERPPTRRS